MRALVIGYGSIGRRHTRILNDLGCEVAIVSRRTQEYPRAYEKVDAALEDWRPEYVVIAGRTSEHFGELSLLANSGYSGRVLVEKPLLQRAEPLPLHNFARAAVGYNLRFHPVLVRLREFLATDLPVASATIYAGQYLPNWRPDTDYRLSYSASSEQGGGVLRDLSHELDAAFWLFGGWSRLASLGGHFSELDIRSSDVYSLLLVQERCEIVSINLNYLDRVPRREFIVHGRRHSVRADLVGCTFEVDGDRKSFKCDRDDTYLAQHRAMLGDGDFECCTLEEGMRVVHAIDAAEAAVSTGKWIEQ